MTIDPSIRLRGAALRLAFKKEVVRQRLRATLSLARDVGLAVLILGSIGGFIAIGSYGLNLFSLR